MTARIFLKLALATMLPLLVAAAAALLLVPRITVGYLEGGLETSLTEKARLIENALEGIPPDRYQSSLQMLAERAQARVTVIDARGNVLADSQAHPSRMENHATRPEFSEALTGRVSTSRRYSTTVENDLLYVAVPIKGGGAVRLALPLEQVASMTADLRRQITVAILLIVAPLLAAVAWAARRISKQLSGIVELSNTIAEGDFEVDTGSPKPGYLPELKDLTSSLTATAAKLKASFQQLKEERSRFVAAVNGIGEGILVLDRRGRIALHNPAIERMFPEEDLSPLTPIKSWRSKEMAKLFRRVVGNREPLTTEFSVDTPAQRAWRVSCAPILSRKGKVRAVAAVFHDITELERIDQMRRDFVINVSHELRTPLASIAGYAETLLDGAIHDKENNERFVRILWQNARRLTQLTSDLMTLSQIEVNAREYEFSDQSAAAIVRLAADGIRPVLQSKELELKVELPERSPTVSCDPGAVQQVLANLLDNAAKYTQPHGRITVGAKRAEGAIHFFVRDTGIGIAAEHMPRLFERFYRVDKARSRELGGTGLGLAIVKHLVQAHGGSAWVESEPGEGSTFSFSLPDQREGPSLDQILGERHMAHASVQ